MNWAWVIPAVNVSAFFAVVVIGRLSARLGAAVSITAIAVSFALFWYVLRDLLATGVESRTLSVEWLVAGDTTIHWGVLVDRLSVVMLGLVTFVALLVQVYSLEYMKGQHEGRLWWYYAVHALFAGAMLALVLADNLLFLYVAWELVGLGSYLLIGFWYERRSAAEAAKKAFVTTRIGDVGLLIGILLLFRQTGTFEISTLFHIALQGGIPQGTLNLAMALIFLGAMGKSAQFPFHVWLPDAMEGPTPVSALIHAATMVAAGVYLVARMMPMFQLAPDVLLAVAVIGLFTFAFAGTMALVMTDSKRVLAYSTISHLGLMMLALGAGSVAAALFHLVAHGVSKALLFLGAGAVTHATGETDIELMGGLWRRTPITAVTFIIGAASLAGIVPLSGFFSKDEVLLAVMDVRNPAFVALALAAALLSSLYMGRLVLKVFFGPEGPSAKHPHDAPPLMTAPLVLLAVPAVFVGFLAFGWTDDFDGFASFIDRLSHHEPSLILATLSAIVALGGAAIAWLVYSRGTPSPQRIAAYFPGEHRVLMARYYVDDVYQWAIDRVVLAVGGFIALFDRVVVNDAGVNGPAVSVRLSALRLRYLQSGRLYNYGFMMALGVVALTLLWWLAFV